MLRRVRFRVAQWTSGITAKTVQISAESSRGRRGRRGRLYVRGFLRIGSTEPLLPPKTTMEMGVHRVHGRSDTPRVSPTPTASTQRLHGQIARVRRSESDRVRRHLAR